MSSGHSGISVQDRHFVIGWSLADTKKVEQYTKRLASMYGDPVHADTYMRLTDAMLDLIQRRDNDHRNATMELGHDWLRVDPIETHSGEDMVTLQGLNKLLKIYIGTSTGTFKWIGRSVAAGTPTPYSTALASETGSRQDSTTTGFHDVKGTSLRIFSSYATNIATATMYQIGAFDASTSGIMLALHDFGGNAYTHTINVDSFSLGMVIDLVPFGDV